MTFFVCYLRKGKVIPKVAVEVRSAYINNGGAKNDGRFSSCRGGYFEDK